MGLACTKVRQSTAPLKTNDKNIQLPSTELAGLCRDTALSRRLTWFERLPLGNACLFLGR